jgi:hypothetical protein
MKAKLTMMLAFLTSVACSSGAAPPAEHAGAVRTAGAGAGPGEVREAPAPPPAQVLSKADLLYQSQLGATRGGKFEIDRQVAELRQAKLLYQQFVERAEGNPELEPAVRKSRERIVDVQSTIDFLLGGEPPGEGEAF